MKTDTLTGPNLSYWVAVLDGYTEVEINMFYSNPLVTCQKKSAAFDGEDVAFDYADPATFQPIAEREKISAKWVDNKMWQAITTNKNTNVDNSRYQRTVIAWGDTEAEARMRCYVKSYLGDDTKGE